MDYVSHIITGATGYRFIKTGSISILSRFQDRTLLTCAGLFFLASILPDVDNISRLWGMDAYIIHHRGITHSLLFAVISSSLLAIVFEKSSSTASTIAVFTVTLSGMLFHLYMDLITSYGTQILLPFTNHRFRLDWVFIVDPIYTIILTVFFILSFVITRKECGLPRTLTHVSINIDSIKGFVTWAFVLWIVAYPVTCGALKVLTARSIGKSYEILKYAEFDLVPDLGSPLIWKLIVKENNTYRVGSVNLIGKSVSLSDQKFTPLDEILSERLSEELPSLKIYRWFAVYPYQRLWQDNGQEKILEIGDIRFFSPSRILQSRRPVPPFTLFIRLSNSGKPLSISYGNPFSSPSR
jgi:inner membrane protein